MSNNSLCYNGLSCALTTDTSSPVSLWSACQRLLVNKSENVRHFIFRLAGGGRPAMRQWLVGALALLLWPALALGSEGERRQLTVYNWPVSVSAEVLKDFEATTGIRVLQVGKQTETQRRRLLAQTGGSGIDILVASGRAMRNYALAGWLNDFPRSGSASGPVHVALQRRFPELKSVALPLYWDALGIAYREDLVTRPPSHWGDLFEHGLVHRGGVLLLDDTDKLFTIAQLALGSPKVPTSAEEVRKAYQLIQRQESRAKFRFPQLNLVEALRKGDMAMAMVFSGEGGQLAASLPRVKFVIPEEGSDLCVMYLALPKASNNAELAGRFIEFLLEKGRIASIARSGGHFSPIQESQTSLQVEGGPSETSPDNRSDGAEAITISLLLDSIERYESLAPGLVRYRAELLSEMRR